MPLIHTQNQAHPVAHGLSWSRGVITGYEGDSGLPENSVVVPGLVDHHGHMEWFGRMQEELDLSSCRTFEELVASVRERASRLPPGRWAIGRGWDQNVWPGRGWPVHDRLSAAVPDRPVWLMRVDGHAGLANTRAMEIAGIVGAEADPPGGETLRDSAGRPTGVFVDAAMDRVKKHVPRSTPAEVRQHLLSAQERCLAAGLAGVHDAWVGPADIEAYRALDASENLVLRVTGMAAAVELGLDWIRANPPHRGRRFHLTAVKLYLDGALGSHGAWLLDDYGDRAGHRGHATLDPKEARRLALAAAGQGYQVCAHAIGDRAVRTALDLFEEVIRKHPGAPRPRIEHAQSIAPDDLPRFGKLGIIASIQPGHAVADRDMAERRLGAGRLEAAYAWRRLRDSGATLLAGSDFPIDRHEPLHGFHAAVTRQDAAGQPPGGWRPEDCLTREEALGAYTGYARLAPGEPADFTVLDRDIFAIPPQEILQTRVLRTVIAGETVFQAG